MFNKAHFSFLEFTTDDQLDEFWPDHRMQEYHGPLWQRESDVFWACMYFGNAELAEQEDNDDENAELALRAARR